MPSTRKVLKVFLASPGDLKDERLIAKKVADEINANWADVLGYQIELVGWEDTVSTYGRPQAVINLELERCEFFIGMVWRRWGTPPSVGGPYQSGFEEEFELSFRRRETKGHPEMSLFFKEVDVATLKDPGAELQKVMRFKEDIIQEKKILFTEFKDQSDFETKIRQCLTHHLQNLYKSGIAEHREEAQERRLDIPDNEASKNISIAAKTHLLSEEGAKFLRHLITSLEKDGDDSIDGAEVARFRLLASIVAKAENDDDALGAHDSNLLYTEKQNLRLGMTEISGLITAGLSRYDDENVPLWHWLMARDGLRENLLPIFAYVGEAKTRNGAISAMRLIAEQIDGEGEPLRKDLIASWFAESSPRYLRISGIQYLGECGDETDLPALRQLLARAEAGTINHCIEAIIKIQLRDSREKAVGELLTLQPDPIDEALLDQLLKNANSIEISQLKEGLSHKSAIVRQRMAEILRERKLLNAEIVEGLSQDPAAIVRYEGVLSLMALGRLVDLQTAKQILVRSSGGGALGRDIAGQDQYEKFEKFYWSKERITLLEQQVDNHGAIYEPHLLAILTDRQFAKRGGALRGMIDDLFEEYFEAGFARISSLPGIDSGIGERLRGIKDWLIGRHLRNALNVIYKHGNQSDLERVRKVLQSGKVTCEPSDIHFLGKYGEWKDIAVIASFVDVKKGRSGLLSGPNNRNLKQAAAHAIYNLGRERFADLITQVLPPDLLAYVIAVASKAVFLKLKARQIQKLFVSQHDDVRKVAALKCVQFFTRSNLSSTLSSYLERDSTYYNVTHWLDMGNALPAERAKVAAARELAEHWPS